MPLPCTRSPGTPFWKGSSNTPMMSRHTHTHTQHSTHTHTHTIYHTSSASKTNCSLWQNWMICFMFSSLRSWPSDNIILPHISHSLSFPQHNNCYCRLKELTSGVAWVDADHHGWLAVLSPLCNGLAKGVHTDCPIVVLVQIIGYLWMSLDMTVTHMAIP